MLSVDHRDEADGDDIAKLEAILSPEGDLKHLLGLTDRHDKPSADCELFQ